MMLSPILPKPACQMAGITATKTFYKAGTAIFAAGTVEWDDVRSTAAG
jgi:hypothetical protein